MSQSAQRMRKKLEERKREAVVNDIVPEHTDNAISGHHENDLIIVYSKYEDLVADDTKRDPIHLGKFVPQWFMTDCVSDTRGVSTTPDQPTLCHSYGDMAHFGTRSINRVVPDGIRKVLFYYSTCLIKVSGMEPFPSDGL